MSVAAELLVTVESLEVIGTVAAFPEAVIALFVSPIALNVFKAVNVFIAPTVGTVEPSTAITPADTLVIEVSVACPNSILPTPNAVLVEAVSPAIGSPVQLVKVPDVGVPSSGVVNVGEISLATFPEPVVAVGVYSAEVR